MIFLANNKITESMLTITGGSTSLDGSRMLNQVAEQVTQFQSIVIDFGEAVEVPSMGVVGVSQDITIEANSADSWTSPPLRVHLEAIPGSNVRFSVLSTPETYRYWRIIPKTYILGEIGPSGGYIFLTPADDGGSYYYEAGPVASEALKSWSLVTEDVPDAAGTAIGDGEQNTADIVAHYPGADYSANYCDNLTYGGADDWFLPSQEEARKIYENLVVPAIGGYSTLTRQTSTEISTTQCRGISFSSGGNIIKSKSPLSIFTPVRRFTNPILNTTTFIGELLIGETIQLPAHTYGSLPDVVRFDGISEGVGGVRLVKSGYAAKNYANVNFPDATDLEIDAVRSYYINNGKLPVILIPYENDDQTTLSEMFTPFWCNPEFIFKNRTANNDNIMTASFDEAK